MQLGVPQIIAVILLVGVVIALIRHNKKAKTPQPQRSLTEMIDEGIRKAQESEPKPYRAPYIFPSCMEQYLGSLDPSYNPTALHDHLCKRANGQPLQTLARIVLNGDVPEDERVFELRIDLRMWLVTGSDENRSESYQLATIVNNKFGTIWSWSAEFDANGVCTVEFPLFGEVRRISINGLEPVQTFTFPVEAPGTGAADARAHADGSASDLHRSLLQRAMGHHTATIGHVVLGDGRPAPENLLPIGVLTRTREVKPEGEAYRVIINSIHHGRVLNETVIFDASGSSAIEFELLGKPRRLTLHALGPAQDYVFATDSTAPISVHALGRVCKGL